MIRKIKQKIRDFLEKKYDVEYERQLDLQVISYDAYIQNKEKEYEKQEVEIVWDLLNRDQEREFQEKSVIFSYCELKSPEYLHKMCREKLQGKEVIILAEEGVLVSEETKKKIEEIFLKDSKIDVLYGDEDEVNSNGLVRMNPWYKPDYSPDTLLSYFYFGSLVAVRKELLNQAVDALNRKKKEQGKKNNKNEKDSECSKDNGKKLLYALILEICFCQKINKVYHLKRMVSSSHHIVFWGFEEEYEELREYYKKLREKEEENSVSIIIPSKDHSGLLSRCLQSIVKHTTEVSYEVIVVDNGSCEEEKEKIEKLCKEYGFSYLYEVMEFNFSRMCNKGAQQAKNHLLLFLNDDCEVQRNGWLSHMVSLVVVKKTGAVGAKLYYPESKRIQHCGIYQIHVGPVHKLQFKEDDKTYYDRRNLGVRNVMAVTAACLLVRKSVFQSVGGFDEELQVAFNDVDFCYKLYEAGYFNVIDNEVFLWHYESLSRGSDESSPKLKRLMQEKQKLYGKHPDLWGRDPYYHEEFSMDILDTGYSFAYEYPHFRQIALEHPVEVSEETGNIREDGCVVPMIEYAGSPEGWFLQEGQAERIKTKIGTSKVAYLQGNAVVLGSDNACFEKKILLYHEEIGRWYQVTPQWYYRPDIFQNLQDQKKVALSGFACLVSLEEMPQGNYKVGICVKDKISKQRLLRMTGRRIENE